MPKAPKTLPSKASAAPASASASSSARQKSKARTSTRPAQLYSNFLPIALSIALPKATPIPASSSSSTKPFKSCTHYIYVRAHAPTGSAEDLGEGVGGGAGADRTAFVANLPVDCTPRALRAVFGRWGVVESVTIGNGSGTDGLERAVRGLTPESDDEDADEDRAVDEDRDDADPSSSARGDAKFIGDLSLPRSKRRRLNKLPASVPDIIPLPPLDPRNENEGDNEGNTALSSSYHPSGARSAHITFLDSISLTTLLSSPSPSPIPYTPSSSPSDSRSRSGLPYYLARHAALRPSLASTRAHADSSMARFDHLSSLLLSARAKQQGAGALVDEDGFTVVVRAGRGRTGGFGDGTAKGTTSVGVAGRGFAKGVKDAQRLGVAEGKNGKGARELVDFYKFQKTERKRQELADLRNQFEKDKRKVAEMRKTNRFKPY